MRKDITTLVSSLYSALMLLCLADKKHPSMDRLYYYVRQMEELLLSSNQKLNKLELKYKSNNTNMFSLHTMYQYFMQTCEITDYCNEFKVKDAVDGYESTHNMDDASVGSTDSYDNNDGSKDEEATVPSTVSLGDRVI